MAHGSGHRAIMQHHMFFFTQFAQLNMLYWVQCSAHHEAERTYQKFFLCHDDPRSSDILQVPAVSWQFLAVVFCRACLAERERFANTDGDILFQVVGMSGDRASEQVLSDLMKRRSSWRIMDLQLDAMSKDLHVGGAGSRTWLNPTVGPSSYPFSARSREFDIPYLYTPGLASSGPWACSASLKTLANQHHAVMGEVCYDSFIL
ncbi:hypothetical protein DEU56DRAFT_156310 [Suillus clintonianus]|uniref:uncharacterized protein n=1 Tax=Suillus clintonianus TaxID=1904413 RepID=UPI001B86ACCB|nr:uncharacterized protein DEU56DRAFT_156310 [Suillus clintonianus]KAG2146811.1 hypothetical protein DEU56DRAFT_156310 [Suillus clintonianus]